MILLLEEAICVLEETPADDEYGLCWAISRAHENLTTDNAWTILTSAESVLYRLIGDALGIPCTYVTDWLFETHGIRLTGEELRDYRIRWATAILEQAKRERDELRKAKR